MKITDIIKAEGEEMCLVMTNERITVGIDKKQDADSCGKNIGGSLYFAVENWIFRSVTRHVYFH